MYQLILNLIPQGILPRINVSQYDHGQEVDVTLYDGSTAYTLPSNATVTVSGTKADNTGFEYNCDLTDGISFAIEEQMTVFAGEVECELTIRYGNNRISTINFIIDVERAALQDNVVISETDLPILQQIPEYAAQASADADRAEQAAATAMSTDAGKVTDRLNLNNTRNLVVPADINYTRNGVTMKTNADGSITLSGAETSGQSYTTTIIFPNFVTTGSIGDTPMGILPSGKYRLWGDTVGGRIQGKAFLVAYKYDANKVMTNIGNNDNGNNRDFELTDAYPYFNLGLVIKGNADFGTGMTIYPMITTQSTTDVTGYEQGALSNRALTIMEQWFTKRFGTKLYSTSVAANQSQTVYEVLDEWISTLPGDSTYVAFLQGGTGVVLGQYANSRYQTQLKINYFGNEVAVRKRAGTTTWSDWVGMQPKDDNSLQTTNKTIVGAINELKARIDAL